MRVTPEHLSSVVLLAVIASIAFGQVACSGTTDTETGSETQTLRTSNAPIVGAIGVVDFFFSADVDTNEPNGACTGSMIARDTVLTAAHCFDNLGAMTANGGVTPVTIRYYDPSRGIRRVYSGDAYWAVYPTYTGSGASGPGGANSDVGLLVVPTGFDATNHNDYLRIYSDADGPLNSNLQFYGAGRYTYSNRTDNRLRTDWFEVENVDENHLVIDNRQDTTVCEGDSGGPLIKFSSVPGGPSLGLVAAVLSSGEVDDFEGNICNNNDGDYDDAWLGRINANRVAWIEDIIGAPCVHPRSTSSLHFKRCFPLPLIEDFVDEGYSRGVGTAIATTVL